jgi:hypothetical protein
MRHGSRGNRHNWSSLAAEASRRDRRRSSCFSAAGAGQQFPVHSREDTLASTVGDRGVSPHEGICRRPRSYGSLQPATLKQLDRGRTPFGQPWNGPGGHTPARDLSLCDGVVSDALDTSFITRLTGGEALVAAVFAQAAAVAGAHVAKGTRGGRGGRGRGLREGGVLRRGPVSIMSRLLQGALEGSHSGAWQDGQGGQGSRSRNLQARK